MNSKDTKNSRELKREVLQELNQVNSDIDRIQNRLTPGQIIDDALFYPVGKNPRAIFDHLTANPIGTAFLGLGTLLLMEDDSHVTYERQMKTRSAAVLENSRYQATLLKGRVSDIKGGVSDKVSGVNGKISGVIDRTKSKVQSLKGKIAKDTTVESADQVQTAQIPNGPSPVYNFSEERDQTGTSGIDQLKSGIGEVKENISGKIDALSDNFNDVKDTAFDQVNTMKNLDPMTYAALGAGLGALTGIALPVSDKEQMLIDQKAAGKLNEFSSEFQDALNQSVKVLKDEFLGKFTDFDVSLFKKPQTNETFRNDSSAI